MWQGVGAGPAKPALCPPFGGRTASSGPQQRPPVTQVDRPRQRSGGGRHGDRRQVTRGERQLPVHLGGPHRRSGGLRPWFAVRGRGGEVPAQPRQPHPLTSGPEPQPGATGGRARDPGRHLGRAGSASSSGREQRGDRPPSRTTLPSPGARGWYWSAKPKSGLPRGGASSTTPTPPTGRTTPTSPGAASPRSPTTGTCTSGTTSGDRRSCRCARTRPTRCGAAPTATSGRNDNWRRPGSASRPSTTGCGPSRTPLRPTASAPDWGRATSET